MPRGGVIPCGSRRLSALFPLALFACLSGGSAWGGGLVGAAYTLNWDSRVDKKGDETTEAWTTKQTLDVRYRGFLQPVIENELTLKVEQERDQNGKNLIRVNPTIILGYKSAYFNAGAKRNVEESNELDKNPKTTDSYFVELFVIPPRTTLPDLKAKYNLDQDFEQDATDTSKHSIAASSIYGPMQWIQFKGDYILNRLYDNLNKDRDTQDDKVSGLVGIRLVLSDRIKFNSEYKAEETRGWTILDAGGRENDKKDTEQTWKNALSFLPFRDTAIDATYDYDLKENKVTGEDSITENTRVALSQGVGPFRLRGEFFRTVNDLRNTVASDDYNKTEDTWTAEVLAKLNKFLDFSLKYQGRTTDEIHVDATKTVLSASKIYSGSWIGNIAPFWIASASFDWTDTFTKEVKTSVDKKYSIRSTFLLRNVYFDLALEPIYEITYREDLVKDPAEVSDIRDFRFRIAYKLVATPKITALLTHTYGRKTDSLVSNILRTDDSSGNILWKSPLPGWNFSFDLTRNATDTSEDDLEPDVNTSFGFKGDMKGNRLAFATSYKYDMKTLSDDTETFDAKVGWFAPDWDVSLTYTYTKTFSQTTNEGYTINLVFKYIIN